MFTGLSNSWLWMDGRETRSTITSIFCLIRWDKWQGRWEDPVFRVNLKYVSISQAKTVIKIICAPICFSGTQEFNGHESNIKHRKCHIAEWRINSDCSSTVSEWLNIASFAEGIALCILYTYTRMFHNDFHGERVVFFWEVVEHW